MSEDNILLLDKGTQNFLVKKYKVEFYDKLEKKQNLLMNEHPIIQRVDRMYENSLITCQEKHYYNYDPFKEFEIPNSFQFNTIEIGNINDKNDITLDVSAGEYIFKGTRDYITIENESKFLENADTLQPFWFGSKIVGYSYSKTYKGGLNAYKFKKDSRLFIINDIRNEKIIIDAVHALTDKDLSVIKHTKQEILDSIRIKYGYDCNIGYQIQYIQKYTKYPFLWIARYVNKTAYRPEIYKYRNKRVYGAGKLDRVFGRFMCNFCSKNNYIGYCSLYNYTVFYSQGVLGDEIVICDQKENLLRDIQHELDWYQWKKFLPFDIENKIFKNYIFNPSFHNKKFLGVFKQYFDNQMDNDRNKNILKIIKKSSPKFKFMTLNVHSFISSNLNDTFIDVVNKLKLLLDTFNIDMCVLEEFSSYTYDDDLFFENTFTNYNILKSNNIGNKKDRFFGNVILAKDIIYNHKMITLPNMKNKPLRNAMLFSIKNKNVYEIKFIATHLEIGDRYTERSGSFRDHAQIVEIYVKNVDTRVSQLNTIIKYNPDIILGDMNFTNDDPEYKKTIKNTLYEDTMKEEYPTLFNCERVDFIFNKNKKIKCDSYVVSYPYSDHLPVIGLLY
jgi:endonuclease/exonuclease/phosphatase family metal-dependent hydrolase